MLDFNKIKEVAQGYQADMTAFLRAIVKNPGESCDEKAHVESFCICFFSSFAAFALRLSVFPL